MSRKAKRDHYVSCILAAAGRGSRMNAGVNKIFLDICGIPVLAHALMTCNAHEEIDELIVVTSECDILGCKDIAEEFDIHKLKTIIQGGRHRQESVQKALKEVSENADIVLVHDAARPLVTAKTIQRVIDGVLAHGAAAAGVPCKNTLKHTDKNGFIIATPDRSRLYEIQTPQGFSRSLICDAHDNAVQNALIGTDDCYLAEQLGAAVKIVEGDYRNIKITTPEDLLIAERFLETRELD